MIQRFCRVEGVREMNNQLVVSIIVPVYNAEKHLKQCLNSLLEQGVSQERYEIICIDDGSKDASFSVIKEYADQHKNIIVIGKENEGVSATRNKGLETAKGKYIWFVDADDWVAKDFLKEGKMVNLLNGESAHIALMLTACIEVRDSETECYDGYRFQDDGLKYEEAKPFMTTARGHFFNRALIEKYGLRFDTNLAYGEDLIFMRDYLDAVRFENEKGSKYSILQCGGKGAYLYRIHNTSAMGQLGNRIEKVADSILYRARLSLERYKMKDKPLWYKENYQEYINLHMQEYMLYYFPALSKPMWSHMRRLRREGLYPAPPPKLGWGKPENMNLRIRQFIFRHSVLYPLYYLIMRIKFKRAGTI